MYIRWESNHLHVLSRTGKKKKAGIGIFERTFFCSPLSIIHVNSGFNLKKGWWPSSSFSPRHWYLSWRRTGSSHWLSCAERILPALFQFLQLPNVLKPSFWAAEEWLIWCPNQTKSFSIIGICPLGTLANNNPLSWPRKIGEHCLEGQICRVVIRDFFLCGIGIVLHTAS